MTWVCNFCQKAACPSGEDPCDRAGESVRALEPGEGDGGTTKAGTCVRCSNPIERGKTVWGEIVGWEQKRTGGGTNSVALRQRTGRQMCDPCMTLERSPAKPLPGQTTIEDFVT